MIPEAPVVKGTFSARRPFSRPPTGPYSHGSRVLPTIIEAGASVGHLSIVYASANVHAGASIGDRLTMLATNGCVAVTRVAILAPGTLVA